MEVVTWAMESLLPKLSGLLMEEYHLHKSVKKDVESVSREMKSMHAALRKVAEVPWDQLDEQLVLWAGDVRELSYNIEDVVDKFLVRVEGLEAIHDSHTLRRLMEKVASFYKKGKTRRQIASAIKDINNDVQELASRRGRYNIDNAIVSKPAAATAIDPRLRALYTDVKELVGIDGKRDQELLNLLSLRDDDDNASKKKLQTVCIVGFGGLGKTTLARAVCDKIKGGFTFWAFVPVGRKPDVKKVFRDILIGLDKEKYTKMSLMILDEKQLIDELREFLLDERYLIIIDDLWDKRLWKYIKLAFSDMGKRSSRLITTTRIVSVSKECCSSTDDLVYLMEPLSADDSKSLFDKRIFSSKGGCPNEYLQLSRDILKKCGGVPLAIITIASLLASGQQIKPKAEWHALLESIGRGLTEDENLEEMQRILSFSYYDLPCHIKTCLLYLSVYPEDMEIQKDQLILKWITESFIRCGNQGHGTFELGETYFNELVNRSLIEPIYDSHTGQVKACRVHDMVLDLIRYISRQANFVEILDGTWDSTSSKRNVRRLSLQNRNEDCQATPPIHFLSSTQVRSMTVFPPAINITPAVLRFEVLRVLDMTGCNLGESRCQLNIKDVGNLLHLRYLGLSGTGIRELPSEIGNLQFLEVLDVGDNDLLEELPATICRLRRLMFLNFHHDCKILPGALGKLTSMQVLKVINATPRILQELCNLTKLRELYVAFMDKSLELDDTLVESLCSLLHNIESLVITCRPGTCLGFVDLLGELWEPSPSLRKYESHVASKLSRLPLWLRRDPSRLSKLSELSLTVKGVQQGDMQVLGDLVALCRLSIFSTDQTESLLIIRADGFRCLFYLELHSYGAAQVVIQRGALPKVEVVWFDLGVRVAKNDGFGDGDFHHLGLEGNLPSLRWGTYFIYAHGVKVWEAKQAHAAVKRAFRDHPSLIFISISIQPAIPQGAHDDDFLWEDWSQWQ